MIDDDKLEAIILKAIEDNITSTVLAVSASTACGDAALHSVVTTLISGPAKDAIGTNGLKRLETFFRLQAGWDGTASKPIDLNSVAVFSRFFAETRLNPKRLGVFMSARGNVVVNWPEQDGQLVELEFHSGGVDYFIESVGDEGTVANDDVGFSRLFQLVSESVAA